MIPGQGAKGFLGGSVVKNPPAIAGVSEDTSLIPGSRRFPWRRKWQPTPVFLPGESHGQRSLVGCSPRGHKELDMTERQSTHACTWIFMFTCDVYMWLPPIRSHHINCTKQGFLYGNHPVCVDHNKLWTVLQEMGIPDHLTCLLRNLYTGQEATVRTGHGTTDWFQIGKGVCQGCILSPY